MEKKLPELLETIKNDWEGEGNFRLMFQDEARFGRISESKRCWGPFPHRPVSPSVISREYIYAYAAVNIEDGQLNSLILPAVNTQCMQIFLDEISSRYAQDRIVMIMDGAGWHKSATLNIPKNLRLLIQPPYSPELNPVENIWEEIREKNFHNKVFSSLEKVEEQLCQSLKFLEDNRTITQSITSWEWIINAIPN